jgi:hypothetical protein
VAPTRATFALSAAGKVKFTVQRKSTGREARGKCVATTKHNRSAHKCTRYVTVHRSFPRAGG